MRFSIDTSSSVIRCAFALLSKDDTDAAFPHGQKEGAYSARGADGSQAPSAMERPLLRHGGEEKEQRQGFGEDQRRRRSAHGAWSAPNAKPVVILMRRQSANRPSGVIAFASALAQSTPSSG